MLLVYASLLIVNESEKGFEKKSDLNRLVLDCFLAVLELLS